MNNMFASDWLKTSCKMSANYKQCVHCQNFFCLIFCTAFFEVNNWQVISNTSRAIL